MNMEKSGRFIAAKRHALGYSQDELGALLSVSGKAVSKWERGLSFPDVSIVTQLATLLKTSIISIMEGCEPSSNASSNVLSAHDTPETAQPVPCDLPAEIAATDTVISPYLFGCNIEHTRSNIFRGLSAQMLQNRKFAGKPAAVSGHAAQWYPIGEKTYFALVHRTTPYDPHPTLREETYTQHHPRYHMHREHECNSQNIINFHQGETAGLGQHEINLQKGRSYLFAVVAKATAPVTLTLAMTSRHGKEVYAQGTVHIAGDEWQRCELELTPCCDDDDADIRIIFTDTADIHLGAVSLMPADHFHGMRADVIALLKEMGLKLLRWPGGNFAGEYNWFDGLLPVDMRAPFQSYMWIETQPHSMGYDYHEINTDDFIALCREVGAQPFITINPAWNTPEESAMWVEYCNGDETTEYGRLRAERGYTEPYNVQFWSLGNEFGYGHMEGDNTPYGYQKIARQHAEAMLQVCSTISFCSSGPYPNKDWATHAAAALGDLSPLVSLHYYAPQREFANIEADYHNCIASVQSARKKVLQLRTQLNDKLHISFDEWNTWYAWYRPSCVTDGIFTGLMLHMIMEEAEKSGIAVACHFEAINEGAIEVKANSACLTATGQAFAMMKHHIGGSVCYTSPTMLATVKDGIMTISAVNPAYSAEHTVKLPVCGQVLAHTLYHGKDLYPHSRFEMGEAALTSAADGYLLTLPAHSMALIQIALPQEQG